jgi:hypothetical protein
MRNPTLTENVIDLSDNCSVRDKHRRVPEAVHWIEPAMADLITTVDLFPDVYAAGAAPIEAKLNAVCR